MLLKTCTPASLHDKVIDTEPEKAWLQQII